MSYFLVFLVSFLLGSIPFGYIVGRIKGVDVRKYGSGNIGATNVSRVLGKKYGALVLFLDALKGALPVLILKYSGFSAELQVFSGLSAILGHCFSPFLSFRGGKGVATGLGAFLVISPKITLLAFTVFLIVFFTTRYVSLSSITAALSYPVLYKILDKPSELSFIFVSLSSLVIVLKHYSNIKRLLKGEEKKYV
ncbi:acyl-phosphate glycerol-3-phosphate acyltransferase [Balnearium lithotrophicum]|uniref:Glycerol-3-phosphate acyltransferase n=1 Tax=Balnearium lithotrophicum TaxID=223788 RepID=A0A521DH11_9BACT|nr:glycerol-3-phosphate 1-O-acyltransferase PlsY [Balnearium lithotrophicum]SMO70916.1 acyl-phosphate glycerol-3-phosphate acyltransferase [Balnearium lithotrophicum]